MTADLIDNANDWVRLRIEIPLEARLSSWLPSVLENQLPERGNSTKARHLPLDKALLTKGIHRQITAFFACPNARLNRKHVRVLVPGQ